MAVAQANAHSTDTIPVQQKEYRKLAPQSTSRPQIWYTKQARLEPPSVSKKEHEIENNFEEFGSSRTAPLRYRDRIEN